MEENWRIQLLWLALALGVLCAGCAQERYRFRAEPSGSVTTEGPCQTSVTVDKLCSSQA